MNVDRPFSCTICGMAYKRRDHLVRHARTTHGGDQVICQECGSRFARAEDLRRHIMTIHRPMPPQPQNPAFRPDCVMVTSEEGHFYYKSPGGEDVTACGVFLITDPDKVVEVYFDHLDVPCNTGGLVSFVDGWEMNGQFFPSADDHPRPLVERFHEFCGTRQPKTVFLSSQNAGLVQYRVPKRGRGFSFHVRYIRNPTPCNILIEGTSDVYTLRNYGKHVNCSLTAVYPAQVRVLQLGVGMAFSKRNLQVETGTIHKCDKRGMPDFVQLGGSEGLDLSTYSVVDSICGTDSLPERVVETILCGVTTVRLVSSGEFDNAVTVQLRQADEEDIPSASLICGL